MQEHDLLTPEGKRVASRGRGAKSKDSTQEKCVGKQTW